MPVEKSLPLKPKTAGALIVASGALLWACSTAAAPAPATAATAAPAPAAAAAPAATPTDMARAKATFESLCSSCHESSLAADSRYNRKDWQAVIDRMYGLGLSASEAQAKEVVDYLAATYPAAD